MTNLAPAHHLTEAQKTELAYLKVLHANLAPLKAYGWRLQFDAFYDQPAEEAEAFLTRWCLGALNSGLEPLISFVETRLGALARHRALARQADQHRGDGGD